MKPGSGSQGLSFGGESIPFTMQAETGQMTLDEAIASGLFDLPDEPGTVRIPVSLEVTLPGHLLHPPQPGSGPSAAGGAHGVPPGSARRRPRRRFGN